MYSINTGVFVGETLSFIVNTLLSSRLNQAPSLCYEYVPGVDAMKYSFMTKLSAGRSYTWRPSI